MEKRFDIEAFVLKLSLASTGPDAQQIISRLDGVDQVTRAKTVDAIERSVVSVWASTEDMSKEELRDQLQTMRATATPENLQDYFAMTESVAFVSKEKGDAAHPAIKIFSSTLSAMSDAEFSSVNGALKGVVTAFNAVAKNPVTAEDLKTAEDMKEVQMPVYKNPFRKNVL